MQIARHTTEIQEFSTEEVTHLGTLWLPEGDGWYPALVLVAGSETTELEPYIAAALSQGYAVLTFETPEAALVPTALAAADSLLMRPDIRPELIGLLGLGAGAWAAAFAAARAPETAFAVLLPGASAAPLDGLQHFADLHCPVLAVIPDESLAASLSEHLAHNPEATVHPAPEAATELFDALGPWLQQQAA